MSVNSQMRVLTESQVKACLTVPLALQASSHAFYTAAHETSVTPNRLILTLPALSSNSSPLHTLFKPSLTPSSLGVKVVSVRPSNAFLHPPLPTVPASILLIHPLTGLPLVTLSATFLTASRTAAGSALSTQLFASPTATSLAIFGAGNQAEAHAHAVLAVRRSIKAVHLINRSAPRTLQLITRLRRSHPLVQFHSTAIEEVKEGGPGYEALRKVVVGCQVICLCTNTAQPLLLSSMVADGTHICAVGSYTLESRECDSALIQRCKVVVDDDNAWTSGDLAQPLKEGLIQRDHVQGVLGDYLSDHFAEWHPTFEPNHEPQNTRQLRTTPECVTLYKSVGTAVQDVVTAYAVYEAAVKANVGTVIDMNA